MTERSPGYPQISYTRRKPHYQQRPIGALCIHCQYKPARPNRRLPHLATNYCSDAHKDAHLRQLRRREMTELANEIRWMLGLPDERGWQFTLPELRAISRRLARTLDRRNSFYPAHPKKRRRRARVS